MVPESKLYVITVLADKVWETSKVCFYIVNTELLKTSAYILAAGHHFTQAFVQQWNTFLITNWKNSPAASSS